MSSILDPLNDAQRQAVCNIDGPMLVLAGAGTGKTKVITHRAAYLVQQGVVPRSILAITFTKKAATEMRERITSLIGPAAVEMSVMTFHGFGYGIVRQHHKMLGLSENFSVISQEQQVKLMKTIIEDLDPPPILELDEEFCLQQISRLKNQDVTYHKFQIGQRTLRDQYVWAIFQRYQEALSEANAVDFDDLIRLPLVVLANPKLAHQYRKRYQFIMVDEFQDTNTLQCRIISEILGSRRDICVVGDDDQAIYGFRGADPTRIQSFPEDYDATVIKLTVNYRCRPHIVDVANLVIEPARDRIPRRLTANRPAGQQQQVVWRLFNNEEDEAEYIATEIERRKFEPRKFAVLCRVRQHHEPIRKALKSRGIRVGVKGVLLLTLHEAKGLQFPTVFIPALEENTLPNWHAVQTGNDAIEEERRLLYVGITRAQEELFLTCSAYRHSTARKPSRFLCP